MTILLSNTTSQPIYEQIASQLRGAILSGELQPGDLLPSIRALAKDLRVSVITTKRAYEELEKDGFLNTVPGKGCFAVCRERTQDDARRRELEQRVRELLGELRAMGESEQDLISLLKEEERHD